MTLWKFGVAQLRENLSIVTLLKEPNRCFFFPLKVHFLLGGTFQTVSTNVLTKYWYSQNILWQEAFFEKYYTCIVFELI